MDGDRKPLQGLVRRWPIRRRILAIAALNSALALALLFIVWDGAQGLSRAWTELRHVRQTERFLDQIDRDTERHQGLTHRYIVQPEADVLAEITRLRETLLSRLRVQARLDPLLKGVAQQLTEVTDRFVGGFDALRDGRSRIWAIYDAQIARPSREMSGLYGVIEGLEASTPGSLVAAPLAKSREAYHAMMLSTNAFYLSTSPDAAEEVARQAAAIRRTVPVMVDLANGDIQRLALDALDQRASTFAQGVEALAAEFAAQARILREEIDGNADRLSAMIRAVSGEVRAAERAAQARFDDTLSDAAAKLGAVAFGFVVVVAGLSLMVSKSIIDPLHGLHRAMTAIAGGRYEEQVPGRNAQDEVGEMAGAVEVFRENAIARQRAEDDLRAAKERAEVALSELREAQASLIEAEKFAALGGLVAGVAHEVNNPVGISLTVASSLTMRCDAIADELGRGSLRKSQLVEFVTGVRDAGTQLVANLMRAGDLVRAFKQIAVDRSLDDRRSFDLAETCEQIIASVRPELKGARVRLEASLPAGIVMDSYPGPLGQVLTNLFLNAVRHAFQDRESAGPESGTEGRVTLTLERAGDRVQITFADDGCGMSEEVARRAFEPFFTTQRGRGGTGLGLHLAYNIVTRQLGGRIALQSAPNAGCRFQIVLPLVAPQREEEPSRQAA